MNRSKQAGMGKKTIVVLLVGLVLASVHIAEAQEQAKIPRIGLPFPRFSSGLPNWMPFATDCANSDMWRAKTSSSSTDMLG